MTFTTKKWFLKSISRQVSLLLVLLLSTTFLLPAFYFYNTQKNALNLTNQTLIKWPNVIILLTAGFASWISNNKKLHKFYRKLLSKLYRKSELAKNVRLTLDETA